MDIDLNADLGEGAVFDAELMPLVTSANVCCGQHAGGPSEIRAAVDLAKEHGVVVGVHPGYADRPNFGRVELALSRPDLAALCLYQIAGMTMLVVTRGMSVKYLKPHGGLYNLACRDRATADAVVEVANSFRLPVVGLPGSQLEAVCRGYLLPFIPEGFADRRYRPDGSLVPRTEPDAFVHDPDEAVTQVEWLIREKGVRTICVHGDNPQAVAFTKAVRQALLARGFTLKPFA